MNESTLKAKSGDTAMSFEGYAIAVWTCGLLHAFPIASAFLFWLCAHALHTLLLQGAPVWSLAGVQPRSPGVLVLTLSSRQIAFPLATLLPVLGAASFVFAVLLCGLGWRSVVSRPFELLRRAVHVAKRTIFTLPTTIVLLLALGILVCLCVPSVFATLLASVLVLALVLIPVRRGKLRIFVSVTSLLGIALCYSAVARLGWRQPPVDGAVALDGILFLSSAFVFVGTALLFARLFRWHRDSSKAYFVPLVFKVAAALPLLLLAATALVASAGRTGDPAATHPTPARQELIRLTLAKPVRWDLLTLVAIAAFGCPAVNWLLVDRRLQTMQARINDAASEVSDEPETDTKSEFLESDGWASLLRFDYARLNDRHSDAKDRFGYVAYYRPDSPSIVFRPSSGQSTLLSCADVDPVGTSLSRMVACAVPNFGTNANRIARIVEAIHCPWDVAILKRDFRWPIVRLPWEHPDLLVAPCVATLRFFYPDGIGIFSKDGYRVRAEVTVIIEIQQAIRQVVEGQTGPDGAVAEAARDLPQKLLWNLWRILPGVYESVLLALIEHYRTRDGAITDSNAESTGKETDETEITTAVNQRAHSYFPPDLTELVTFKVTHVGPQIPRAREIEQARTIRDRIHARIDGDKEQNQIRVAERANSFIEHARLNEEIPKLQERLRGELARYIDAVERGIMGLSQDKARMAPAAREEFFKAANKLKTSVNARFTMIEAILNGEEMAGTSSATPAEVRVTAT